MALKRHQRTPETGSSIPVIWSRRVYPCIRHLSGPTLLSRHNTLVLQFARSGPDICLTLLVICLSQTNYMPVIQLLVQSRYMPEKMCLGQINTVYLNNIWARLMGLKKRKKKISPQSKKHDIMRNSRIYPFRLPALGNKKEKPIQSNLNLVRSRKHI